MITKTMGLDEIQQHVRKKLETDKGVELRIQRNVQAEGTFDQIKENYNYDQFCRRGLDGVKKEFLLVVISFNLRKLHTKLHDTNESGANSDDDSEKDAEIFEA